MSRNSSSSSISSGDATVLGLLGVAFFVLKLISYIDWSWWWVTAPFWGGYVFAFAVATIRACLK